MIYKNTETLEAITTFPPLNIQARKHNLYIQNYKLKKPYKFVNDNTFIGIELEVELCPNIFNFDPLISYFPPMRS
jgi:hypothetical protein